MKKVVFTGLGAMGYPMAGHLNQLSDIDLHVWNRTISVAEKWQQQYQGQKLDGLENNLKDAEVVITCVGADEDLQEILFGKYGVADQLSPGAIVIDHSTISCQMATSTADRLKKNGIEFLDAPVSGGESGAQQGVLSIMVGGETAALQQIMPLLQSYGKAIHYIGKSGSGQLTKMVNQICVVGVMQGLCEAITFAEAEGLDFQKVLSAISGGAAQSWQMDNRAKTMHNREFNFGFAIKWMVKDLGYCLDRGKQNSSDLPVAKMVHERLTTLMEKGHQEIDSSGLILYKE